MARGGLKLEDVLTWGAIGLGAYEGGIIILGIDPLIQPDPIHDFLVKNVVPLFKDLLGTPSPTAQLPGPSCNKTCEAGMHLDNDCDCVNDDVVPPPTTQPPPTTPPPPTYTYTPTPLPGGACTGDHLNRYPVSKQQYFCNTWCTGWKCDRYCFCRECQTGACVK